MSRYEWNQSALLPSLLRRDLSEVEHSLPEVLTGARYQAADGQYPGWSAMYEVSTPEFFKQDKYTRLRANRSPREANLIGRLSILDRRTYTSLVADSAEVPPRGKERASPYLVTVASDEVKGEEAVRVLEGVEGWTRSHAYKLGDALTIGEGREPSTRAPAYVVVHGASCLWLSIDHL